jgi:hypothetical protein
MTHDIFISYAAADKAVTDALCSSLENRKIRCWMAPRDIPVGVPYAEALIQAIKESQIIVLVFSKNSNNAHQVMREVERAVSIGIPIIIFRIEDITPSKAMEFFLSTPNWLEATEPPFEDHLLQLADKVHNLLADNRRHFPETEQVPISSEGTICERLQVVDSIIVQGGLIESHIQFCIGDLTKLTTRDAVDVLVVSAFRDIYSPAPGSLINSLNESGVSIEELAKNKEVDLRQAFSCWMSRDIFNPQRGIYFKRILCFEPSDYTKTAELVGDIFRSLAPFMGGEIPIRVVATPLVGSGYQRANPELILRLLVEASVHWISVGLPLPCIKIVCNQKKEVENLSKLFSQLKQKYSKGKIPQTPKFSHDIFISYSHRDSREVKWFEKELTKRTSKIKVFIDQKNLNPGMAWQREIFEAMDRCRKVITFYSSSYLDSKVCLEEFNIALCRHRESSEPILLPVYLYTANLPTYMKLVQFCDCREFDKNKLNRVIDQLFSSMRK